jgi:hypothetical protein
MHAKEHTKIKSPYIDNQQVVNSHNPMKAKPSQLKGNRLNEPVIVKTITFQRAKEITKEEEIQYTDEELTEILQFVAKIVSITTAHNERTKQNEATVININTNTTHETKSIPLHPCQHRRAS